MRIALAAVCIAGHVLLLLLLRVSVGNSGDVRLDFVDDRTRVQVYDPTAGHPHLKPLTNEGMRRLKTIFETRTRPSRNPFTILRVQRKMVREQERAVRSKRSKIHLRTYSTRPGSVVVWFDRFRRDGSWSGAYREFHVCGSEALMLGPRHHQVLVTDIMPGDIHDIVKSHQPLPEQDADGGPSRGPHRKAEGPTGT